MDILLNRRLYRRSRSRWLAHSLIFVPFLLRFLWGLVALVASRVAADGSLTWQLLDKNHPATAFFFDATGSMVVLGVVLAVLNKCRKKTAAPGTPGQDLPALLLVGGVILSGFLLEGIRMAMATQPAGAAFAFAGHMVSLAMVGVPLLDLIYGYVWYGHAICVGLFLIYLPFSPMKHIILSPIVMLVNGLRNERAASS